MTSFADKVLSIWENMLSQMLTNWIMTGNAMQNSMQAGGTMGGLGGLFMKMFGVGTASMDNAKELAMPTSVAEVGSELQGGYSPLTTEESIRSAAIMAEARKSGAAASSAAIQPEVSSAISTDSMDNMGKSVEDVGKSAENAAKQVTDMGTQATTAAENTLAMGTQTVTTATNTAAMASGIAGVTPASIELTGSLIGLTAATNALVVAFGEASMSLAVGAGTGAAVGAGAGAAVAVAHSGGEIGVSSFPSRLVDSNVFAFAPRLHSGLASDEFPTILQRGETVLKKGSPPSATHNYSVNIPINVAGGVSKVTQANMEKRIRDVVIDELQRAS